jgi:hypothetical protein
LISVINFVVENQKSSIIRDDLEKAMWLLFITWLSNMLMLTSQQNRMAKFAVEFPDKGMAVLGSQYFPPLHTDWIADVTTQNNTLPATGDTFLKIINDINT